jgi:hypothetical protein
MFVEDPKSLENALEILGLFEQYAGLRLNKTKTEAMWLGRDRNKTTTPLSVKWVKEVHSLGIFFSYNTDSVILKNFSDRAKEFKRILDMWSQRDLSLIGKITILKSLAFSKVIYQCGSVTTPADFCKLINDIAFNFLWQNKPDKIKRQTIIADYEKGGLKMLDFFSFIKAQKAMWVKRLDSDDNASWKAAPNFYLKEFLGKDTFKCQMDYKEKPKGFPHFYWQVWQSWMEIREITKLEKRSPIEVRRECLWLNKNIKLNKKMIKWNKWREHGINIIHDIVDEKGNFLTQNKIEELYGFKCDILLYNALKDVIPTEWRKEIKLMTVPRDAVSFKESIYIKIGKNDKSLTKITNKDLYWILVRKKQIKPIFMDKLQQELGIAEDEWETILKMPKCITHTKIQTFQYKLLFNLLPCNLYLNRIQKCDSNKCRECNRLDDSAHYLFECPRVVPFWNSFMDWWNAMTNGATYLDKRSAITGFVGKDPKIQTLNACLLLAKWHIYKCNLSESQPFFYKFLCDLKQNLNIEYAIAINKNKIQDYNTKWQMVDEYVT